MHERLWRRAKARARLRPPVPASAKHPKSARPIKPAIMRNAMQMRRKLSCQSWAADHTDQYQDEGHDQKNVNKSAHGCRRYQA